MGRTENEATRIGVFVSNDGYVDVADASRFHHDAKVFSTIRLEGSVFKLARLNMIFNRIQPSDAVKIQFHHFLLAKGQIDFIIENNDIRFF